MKSSEKILTGASAQAFRSVSKRGVGARRALSNAGTAQVVADDSNWEIDV